MNARWPTTLLVRAAIACAIGGVALTMSPTRLHAIRSVRFGRGHTSATRTEAKSTIDDDVQRAIGEAFARVHAARGSAIVMEAGTGRVIADYEQGGASNYRDVQHPGFVFVPFSIASRGAVEMGIYDMAPECSGSLEIGHRTWHCTRGHAHGRHVPLIEALRGHCYVFFFNALQAISFDMVGRAARRFGFGASTESGVSDERRGWMPLREDVTRVMGRWRLGYQLNTGIGYEFARVTPIQLAVAYGALVNGGYVLRPRILEHGNDPERSLRIADKSATRDVLDRLITALDGAARDQESRLVGLDSHPQEIDRNGDETSTVQSWFAGYFPRAHPRYVVIVRVTEAKTTDTRAREIATAAMNAMP